MTYIVLKWQSTRLLVGGKYSQFEKADDEAQRAWFVGDYTAIQIIRVAPLGTPELIKQYG